ncbi:hypothetical protein OG373_06785 [Streptomyces avidinii]|uniref:hypothetical protein n=1 Tax=Streptomyces avidinii TaxID=1895 RepID=UPI003862ED7D|nr:hypothetical protein OG373_06785 [Streptomyces avidinii]
MTTNAETPQRHTGGSPEGSAGSGSTATTVAQPTPVTQRLRPGAWPACPYTEPLLVRARAERARRALTLGSIRADLEEQPSAPAIRASARRWATDVLALAEDVAAEKTETAR